MSKSSSRPTSYPGIICAPVTLPLRKYPGRGWSCDTPKSGVFSISLIKKLREEWEGNNCRILLKYKIKNTKERLPLRIVQINSFVTYLTVIFKKVPVLVMSSSNTKDTPKKIYPKSATSNTCRLYGSIYGNKYLKNLYNKANFQLLLMAKTDIWLQNSVC